MWNGEDLSIFSLDDKALPLSPNRYPQDQKSANNSTMSVDRSSPAFSNSRSSNNSPISPRNLKQTLSTPSLSSQRSSTPAEIGSNPGYRAAEAFVRPSPIATAGDVISYGFDLRNCTFTLALECKEAATEDAPTETFLPEYHFPRDATDVEVSSGKWTISVDDEDGGMIQRLRWWHDKGKQSLTVKGVKIRSGTSLGQDEEAPGYLEWCQQTGCRVM